ncbi:MAG: four helix bundle protein [Isosphaeraceae bacterium]
MGTTRRDNDALEDRLLDFAAGCGTAVDALPETRMGRRVAAQLVRCGTSAAPNYAEARAAESRNDFVHKLGIALKELRETRVWLLLCAKCDLLPPSMLAPLADECTQLMNILGKSIVTAKANADPTGARRARPLP